MQVEDKWRQIDRMARGGKIPFIAVTSAKIEHPMAPKPRVKDLPHPVMQYRTRARHFVYCIRFGCPRVLRKDRILCCSPECEAEVVTVCQWVLDQLKNKPQSVDGIFGRGQVRALFRYLEKYHGDLMLGYRDSRISVREAFSGAKNDRGGGTTSEHDTDSTQKTRTIRSPRRDVQKGFSDAVPTHSGY